MRSLLYGGFRGARTVYPRRMTSGNSGSVWDVMKIQETISDISARLRQGKFPNEQSISQGIVLRLLADLGWETWDTTIVWPEYQTGEGRADFALCDPPSKAAIFIEVKQVGKAEDAVRQALEYAFHTGVPFVVLTDGRTWGFYLPAEQGSYEDRRIYKLDLFERPANEAAEILLKYLSRERVVAKVALDAARAEYRSRTRRSLARNVIPEVWCELVAKGDELLVELLANAVESKAGVRPDNDDVAEFLARLDRPGAVDVVPRALVPPLPGQRIRSSGGAVAASRTSRRGQLELCGTRYQYNNAKDAMVLVLKKLAERDPSFLEKCSEHPDIQGRKRRYIARTPEELYPDRPDLHGFNEQLPGGWLVATNLNNVLKMSIIRTAAEVAGLSFGTDVIVEF